MECCYMIEHGGGEREKESKTEHAQNISKRIKKGKNGNKINVDSRKHRTP